MPIKYTTTKKASHAHGVKMLIYGRSGVGKTSLLATAPNPIILSAESGLLSLTEANQRRMFGKAVDIQVALIRTIDDLVQAHEDLSGVDVPFDTICLDSVTEMGEVVLSNAKQTSKDPRQAYGELLDRMTQVLKAFRDIEGKHVVFIAKEESRGQNDSTLYGPAMPGSKLGPQLPYLFDEVFHLAIGETPEGVKYRYLQTQPDLQFDAKDRSGALDHIEEPNLTKLINKIRSHV